MGFASDDGTYHKDELDYLINSARGSEKRRSDSIEMAQNEKSGDFQSRFYATDASRMPSEAPELTADALKSFGSTRLPGNDENKPERSVLQKLTGSDGGERFQTWPERLVRSAFTLPGDVLAGKVEPGSVQEIERAADLAGLVVLGPAPVASKLADGSLGSFAGVKSKTIPKDKLYEAQNMELDMIHPDEIWEKTGFFRGADQRWRYEIPDIDAKLKPEAFDRFKETTQNPSGWENTGNHGEVIESWRPKAPVKKELWKSIEEFDLWNNAKPVTLDKVIDHPELFKAYPELQTMKVEPLPEYLKSTNVKGQVVGDTIYLAEGHPEYLRSVILHEIQHGIQHYEGFARGGNAEQFLPKELPQAEKEFLQIKKEEEPKIIKELGEDATGIYNLMSWKARIRDEQEGFPQSAVTKDHLEQFKKEHPALFNKISNIVKSERLIEQAKEEAFSKYQRLMGEVESRNVQARMNYGKIDRRFLPPYRTEDKPRIGQINPE